MKRAITIPQNVRYIESFGANWVPAVLLRKVNLTFLEENRRAAAGPAESRADRKDTHAGDPISMLGLHFSPGDLHLSKAPKEILEHLFRDSSHKNFVRETLARASLTEGDLQWRTEMRGGVPSIAGNPEVTFNALGALAHELGHCLYEGKIGCPATPSFEVASEATAMALEEWVVEHALPVPLRSGWKLHQRRLDRLNRAFDAMERTGYSGEVADTHLLPLRATYYTAYGYQAVYRRASQMRSLALASEPNSVEEVLRAILLFSDPVHGAVELLG